MSENSLLQEADYRRQSFWLDSVPGSLAPRPALEGDQDADVVVIGAGYTGLWTAYYLKRHAPDLNIAVLEANIAGYGASGRNGGWCSAYLSCMDNWLENPETRSEAIALQRLMFDAVDEVGRVAEREQIDCHFVKGGHVDWAESSAQLARCQEEVEWWHELGFGEDDIRWMEPGEIKNRINVSQVLGGFFMSHCAPIQPARLARGLADTIERMGVRLYEQSPANDLGSGQVSTPRGRIRTPKVLMATEGFSYSLGFRRKLIPIHSNMVVTEPLSDAQLAATGIDSRFCFNNGRHLVIYAQLTQDGRIAFGHRGSYLYGAKAQTEWDPGETVFASIEAELKRVLPALSDIGITHTWGGPMGVSRDLLPSVCFDHATGTGWAGGYFGDGVGAAQLAGRTLADLVLRRDTERSRSLWVNRPRARNLNRQLWEPEPLRWLGVRSRYSLMGLADRAEARNGPLAGTWNWMLNNLFP